MRLYNQTPRGIARNLRCEHGINKETSMSWALVLLDPGSRCAICGLPNYLLRTLRDRGWPWFLGRRFGAGSHPRLTLDHLVPADNSGGFRPLCHACNSLRGAGRYTDTEVFNDVRSKWLWFTGIRFLWWLNTSPGVGGRLHRSDRCQKRDAEFADGASPQPDPTTRQPSTPSPSSPMSATSAS
jgi:hypothetical protein